MGILNKVAPAPLIASAAAPPGWSAAPSLREAMASVFQIKANVGAACALHSRAAAPCAMKTSVRICAAFVRTSFAFWH